MAEDKENQKGFNMGFEGTPCAEMMHKCLGQKGMGSICADMVKKMREPHGDGGGFSCAEMMASMMKGWQRQESGNPGSKEE